MARLAYRILSSWTLSVVFAIFIALVSLAPYNEMNLFWDTSDKIKHFLAYLVWGVFLFYPLKHRLKTLPVFLVMILVVVICTLYGIVMELGQFLSPGRHPSYWDAKMNLWGSLFGQVVLFISHLARQWRGQPVSK
jgi:VanZ family protein